MANVIETQSTAVTKELKESENLNVIQSDIFV